MDAGALVVALRRGPEWYLSPGILKVEGGMTDGTPQGDPIDIANAHMIAAAPDLYDALEKAINLYPHRVVECNGDKCREGWCASCYGWDAAEEALARIDAERLAARAALAKARGEIK